MKRLLPLIVLVAVAGFGPSSQAATLTVSSAADSGPGTLRAALVAAAAGDTIEFATPGPIVLTSGALLVDKALTIAGPGPALLTVERDLTAAEFRIFEVTANPVAISGLTIRQGRAVTGGGLLNAGVLTLTDCVITHNTATGSAGVSAKGGGIHNDMADLRLDGVTVISNTADGGTEAGLGGGLYADGRTSLTASLLANNQATGAAGAFGGALYGFGTTKATATVFTQNTAAAAAGAEARGGAIYNEGDLTLLDCSISGNEARGGSSVGTDGGPALGGGLASAVSTVRLSRSTLSGNRAVGGNSSGGMNGPAGGGGLHAGFGTTVGLTNCTLSGNGVLEGTGGNAAFSLGAGLLADFSTVYLFNSTVASNVMALASPEDGAGLYVAAGVTLECQNSIVAANDGTLDLFVGESSGYVSYGHNLIGTVNAPSDGPLTPGVGDQFLVNPAALKLGPLQDNGGPTRTHALLCGSLALDAGDAAGAPPTDQRGFPRVVGGTIDVGAYEAEGTGSVLVISGCPDDLSLGCNPPAIPGCDPADVTATGGCGTVTVTCRVQDSATGCQHTRTVTYTARDEAGNEAECSRTITWTEDRTAPVFTRWPGDLNLGVNPASVPGCDVSQVEATADCGPVTITCTSTDSGSACARTRTILYTATSLCGNTATHTQRITWTVLAPADFNQDGCVDLTDYNLIMAQIRAKSTNLTYDLNGDSKVTIADARSVVVQFTNPGGAPCKP